MNKANPKTYFLAAEVLEMVWVGLHESGQEDLARVVSDSMITQEKLPRRKQPSCVH